MSSSVSIRMMGEFTIIADGTETGTLVSRSRKGVALIEYLILNIGKQVPKQRLLNLLWSNYIHMNPESALKTLVSRLRKMLNEIHEGLGGCIVAQRGSYSWESLPDMKIDLLEIMEIFEALPREKEEARRIGLYKQLLRLYTGDLFLTGDIEGGEGYKAALHSEYLNAVYEYIELLSKREELSQILEVCRKTRKVDEFDERLYMEMMRAQVESNRVDDAMESYRKVTDLTRRHLDSEPSEEIQTFYKKVVQQGSSLRVNLETVRGQLMDPAVQVKGAYVCEFEEFRRLCNLMLPTLDRLGCSMFIGLITIQDQNETGGPQMSQGALSRHMDILLEILHDNLRRGDTVARYSDSTAMVLLPTVNYTTGNMIMERIRSLYLEKGQGEKIPFQYRLGELQP